MGYIIKRTDADALKHKKQWLLVYGRRKVGKTFLLRELCSFKHYYLVKKELTIATDTTTIPLDTLHQHVKTLLHENKTVVIDEFQRLPQSVIEDISLAHPHGKLILSGSSLRIVKKIFEPQSPLLGLLSPIKIGFISPSNILIGLAKKGKFKDELCIELATFLREPWLIPQYNAEAPLEFIYDIITTSKYTITSLIGEIFSEEERELTKKYEAIISLIGSGMWNTKELTSILFSRKLIPDPSPTHLIQYLKNLEEMELVESIKLHHTKGRYYRLISPIMNMYYYLESRYDISRRTISFSEVKPTLEKLFHLEIQNFIADMFAEIYEGRKEYFVSPEKEVDFIITKRNKPEVIGEVKWKKINKEDIIKFRKNSERFHSKLVLVCKGGEAQENDIEILHPTSILAKVRVFSAVRKLSKNYRK